MCVLELPRWLVELGSRLGRKMNLKPKRLLGSGKSWPVFEKMDFEAFRVRIWRNSKHESCSEQFFLGSSLDSFPKWGSNGLRFHENPRLTCPDFHARPVVFQRENERVRGRTGFFIKHESFMSFWDLKVLWRQIFQILLRFLNKTMFLKTIQETVNSCTRFSEN